MTSRYRVSRRPLLPFLLGTHRGEKVLDQKPSSMFNFLRNGPFSTVAAPLCTPTSSAQGLRCLQCHQLLSRSTC